MKSVQVLVIDDEEIVLASVRKILEAEGMAVETAGTSRGGLELALSGAYDLLLSDIRMPEIGGMRILRDVKRAKPRLPVIMITGYATVRSAVQAMKLGAANYLEKPFTPDALIEAVRHALEQVAVAGTDSQELVHRSTVLEVLERAATDHEFVARLLYHGADALDEYDLTGPERLAILTGDLPWIESYTGTLSVLQRRWLEERLSAEIW